MRSESQNNALYSWQKKKKEHYQCYNKPGTGSVRIHMIVYAKYLHLLNPGRIVLFTKFICYTTGIHSKWAHEYQASSDPM